MIMSSLGEKQIIAKIFAREKKKFLNLKAITI